MFIDQDITRFDDARNSLKAMVQRGNTFTVQKKLFSIPTASSVSILISTGSSIVSLESLVIRTNATTTSVELFRDTVFTTSDVIIPFNRNDNSSKTFSTITSNGTSSADGSLVITGAVIGPAVKPNEVEVVEKFGTVEFLMRPNTNYSIKITNNDADASDYIADITFIDNQ